MSDNRRPAATLTSLFLLALLCFSAKPLWSQPDTQSPWVSRSAPPQRLAVDLRSLPVLPRPPGDPLYERLEDLEEDMQPITPQALQEALAYRDPLADLSFSRHRLSLALPGPSVDVAGINSPSTPPDPAGDVGPNHYIQATNASRIQIFDKQGNTLAGPFLLETLWGPGGGVGVCSDGRGDPIIVYDHLADRWLLSEFASGGNRLCVYVSQTPDPVSGGWFAYGFDTPNFPDYPKYGVWPEAYLVSSFEGSLGAYALDRNAMLTGQPATLLRFVVPQLAVVSGFRSTRLLPANLDGPPPPDNTPALFFRPVEAAQDLSNPTDRLEIYELVPNFASPQLSTFGLAQMLTPTDFALVPCSPGTRDCVTQLGSNEKLDALSGRGMMQLQYRDFIDHEVLLTNVTVNAGGGTVGIRWWELRRTDGDWIIHQEGTHSPDDQNRWMASMGMNGKGEIGLAYSLAGSSHFPSIAYTLRQPHDAPGVFPHQEVVAAVGTGPQTSTSSRWGDYSSLNIDPVDDRTFWYTHHYSSDRRTRVLAFGLGTDLVFADGFDSGALSAWSNGADSNLR